MAHHKQTFKLVWWNICLSGIILTSCTTNALEQNVTLPITLPKESPRRCQNANGYENLDLCIQDCKTNHLHQSENSPSLKDTIPPGQKMRFKVVELKRNEFVLERNGKLDTNLPTPEVNSDSFILSSGRAYVCYPLDQEFITCEKWFLYGDEIELRNNSRYLWNIHHKILYPLGQFYVEVHDGDSEFAVCLLPGAVKSQHEPMKIIYLVAYCISTLSLVITFILSILKPELNIRHNYILLCHMVILALAYFFLVIQGTLTITITGCLALALLKQFSLLASFFWINVQAIDLFIRFINLRGNTDMKTNLRRFAIYSIYAWGCPLMISAVTLGMEKSNVQHLHPSFGRNCWFDKTNHLTVFVYFYGPIIFILIANIILFILTVSKLYKVGKNATNVNKKMHNQLLQLYLKLFVVMGLCWIMEIISWAVGGDEKNWIFTDLINGLQGLFIFTVYVCKPSYLKKIFRTQTKWWPWKRSREAQPSPDDDDVTPVRGFTTSERKSSPNHVKESRR